MTTETFSGSLAGYTSIGTAAGQISSGQYYAPATAGDLGAYKAAVGAGAQSAKLYFGAAVSGTFSPERYAWLRLNGSLAAGDYYQLRIVNSSSSNTAPLVQCYKWTGGTNTFTGFSASPSATASDIWEIIEQRDTPSAGQSTISVKQNGTVLNSFVDTSQFADSSSTQWVGWGSNRDFNADLAGGGIDQLDYLPSLAAASSAIRELITRAARRL